MRILVLGARGILGTELVRVLGGRHEVIPRAHGEVDICDLGRLEGEAKALRPEAIVNAAAWTDVDGCEGDPQRAYLVNAIGARNVAIAARAVGAKLVHISTDYVFDGEKEGPYLEDDPPRPLNVYGRSKLLGEVLVREQHPEHFILRTSWLYGATGKNFPLTILSLAQEREVIRVVDDQRGTPTWARDLARQVLGLLETEAYGLYHASSEGSATWFEFARELLALWADDREDYPDGSVSYRLGGRRVRLVPIRTEEFPRPARRPKNSVLENFLLKVQGLNRMPPWQDSLKTFVEELKG